MISTATIVTAEPARIILRLCKHWGHKWPVPVSYTHHTLPTILTV